MFGKPKIIIKINGMDCEHCAHHVKMTIENLDSVEKADVNLKKGEAAIILCKNNPAAGEAIVQAVRGIGYEAAL